MAAPTAHSLIDTLIYQLRCLSQHPAADLEYVRPDLIEAESLIGPAAELLEERAEREVAC